MAIAKKEIAHGLSTAGVGYAIQHGGTFLMEGGTQIIFR